MSQDGSRKRAKIDSRFGSHCHDARILEEGDVPVLMPGTHYTISSIIVVHTMKSALERLHA